MQIRTLKNYTHYSDVLFITFPRNKRISQQNNEMLSQGRSFWEKRGITPKIKSNIYPGS